MNIRLPNINSDGSYAVTVLCCVFTLIFTGVGVFNPEVSACQTILMLLALWIVATFLLYVFELPETEEEGE